MTNYQMLKVRYNNWVPSKARIIAAYGLAAVSGDLRLCNEMDCNNCIFNDPKNRACGDITESWLDQEVEI